MTTLSTCLSGSTPGWEIRADVVVVGSGVAGLSTAIRVRESGRRVLLVTKGRVDEGSTKWAQGGIAAALAADDSPDEHLADTLVAGVGLCDEEAVRILVTHGPHVLEWLMRLGAKFDTDSSGEISLTREGGHHHDRIAHAGGDATGAEITRALVAAVNLDPGIELIEHALALDLLTDDQGAAQGVTLHVMGEGQRGGIGAALAPIVILATGGFGQVFGQTTNPYVSTGDGVALALRAGADIADLEFVQFHPTVMWLGPHAKGQQPLVSEAVRGEGAVLRDSDGVRFMTDVHPLADLAPRDVVAKAILRRMRQTGSPNVWLDGRHLGADTWVRRFPTILESCRGHGIDPVTDLIPVSPAQHFASGGVLTDHWGRTSIPGLYACGEVACTGVHGANRLASNSLLEGLVFADRIAEALLVATHPVREVVHSPSTPRVLPHAQRRPIQQAMDEHAGVLRSAESLRAAQQRLAWLGEADEAPGYAEHWETTNIHSLATVLVNQALLRQETRGSHWREDFPERNDERWQRRIVTRMAPDGSLSTRTIPIEGDR